MVLLIKAIDSVNRYAGYLAALLLIPLSLITAYEVFMRYIMEHPTIWSWDLNIQIFAAIIMLGGGDTLRRNGHVVMDVMVQNMSNNKKAVINIINSSIFFLGIGVLFWGGVDQALASWNSKECMPTVWGPPYYIMKSLIPIGAGLLFLQGLAELFRNILTIANLGQRV